MTMAVNDEINLLRLQRNGYNSWIKVKGISLLPPLITSERRLELQTYKRQAMDIERRLKCQRDLKLFIEQLDNNPKLPIARINSYFEDYETRSNISRINKSNKSENDVPSRKKCNLTCHVFDVSEYRDNGVVIFSGNPNDRGEENQNVTDEVNVADQINVTDFFANTSHSDQSSPKPRLRSNSYTLEAPSPSLMEHFKKLDCGDRSNDKAELIDLKTSVLLAMDLHTNALRSPKKSKKRSSSESKVSANDSPEVDLQHRSEIDFSQIKQSSPRKRPPSTLGSPMNTQGSPMNTQGSPRNTLGSPLNIQGPPPNTLGSPPNTLGYPQNTLGSPLNTLGSPLNTLGSPPNALGSPPNALGFPLNTQRSPPNTLGSPLITLESPLNTPRSPPNTLGSPPNILRSPPNTQGSPPKADITVETFGLIFKQLAEHHFGSLNQDGGNIANAQAALQEALSKIPEQDAKVLIELLTRDPMPRSTDNSKTDDSKTDESLYREFDPLSSSTHKNEEYKKEEYLEFELLKPPDAWVHSPQDALKMVTAQTHSGWIHSRRSDTVQVLSSPSPLLIDFDSSDSVAEMVSGKLEYLDDSGSSSKEVPRQVKEQWAATVLTSAARGYLVRRLKRTERVKNLIQTIQDTLLCAMSLHKENVDSIRLPDVELHRRLIQQLSAACYEFHDVFFGMSKKEQMALISLDRQRQLEKKKRPKSTPNLKMDSARSQKRLTAGKHRRILSPSFAA